MSFPIIGPGAEPSRIVRATLADDATYDLPDNSAGFGFVFVGDGEEYAQFFWTSAEVVTLLASSANVVTTDTDTKFCIFDNTGKVSIKNRLGFAKNVIIEIVHWIP